MLILAGSSLSSQFERVAGQPGIELDALSHGEGDIVEGLLGIGRSER
jgi:hypothetical protein